MTVLRLLSGERGYARLEPPDVRDALQREAAATNPDAGLFRNFPEVVVMINRIAAERFLKERASPCRSRSRARRSDIDEEQEGDEVEGRSGPELFARHTSP
jgi:hypothetical protein